MLFEHVAGPTGADGAPGRASIWVQASSSQASATISHQTWFCAKPFSGRFRSPVSLAFRMRSSHRARRMHRRTLRRGVGSFQSGL